MELTKDEILEIIAMEIEVDTYHDDEVNIAWAIFMEENLCYPFIAEYLVKKVSGEEYWKEVEVISNETDESTFGGNAFYVNIDLDGIVVATNLNDLRNIRADKETSKTLQIWNYRQAHS